MRKMLAFLGSVSDFVSRATNKFIVAPTKKARFAKCGKNVTIGKNTTFSYQNIHCGNNVAIGSNSMFLCTRAKIILGDHVMFGPHVQVITGGHRTDIPGRYMDTIKNSEKRPEDDREVIFEGDNLDRNGLYNFKRRDYWQRSGSSRRLCSYKRCSSICNCGRHSRKGFKIQIYRRCHRGA